MDRAPLVSTYTFPVSQPREIRAVCDPSMPLLPEDESLHENLSAVQGGARFEQIEKRIRMANRGQYVRELVTGHAGSGKSTELLRLAARLRAPKETQSFHVVYIDAFEYLSQWGNRRAHIPRCTRRSSSGICRYSISRHTSFSHIQSHSITPM